MDVMQKKMQNYYSTPIDKKVMFKKELRNTVHISTVPDSEQQNQIN